MKPTCVKVGADQKSGGDEPGRRRGERRVPRADLEKQVHTRNPEGRKGQRYRGPEAGSVLAATFAVVISGDEGTPRRNEPTLLPEILSGSLSVMAKPKTSPMADYRARQRARGLVRVEVRTAREDAELVRGVAKALSDPERAASARAALSKLLTPAPDLDFKAFLTAVSFEGVDLERRRDFGRHVEL